MKKHIEQKIGHVIGPPSHIEGRSWVLEVQIMLDPTTNILRQIDKTMVKALNELERSDSVSEPESD